MPTALQSQKAVSADTAFWLYKAVAYIAGHWALSETVVYLGFSVRFSVVISVTVDYLRVLRMEGL